MSNASSFASAMSKEDGDYSRQLNGGQGDESQSRRGPPKPKNKNYRGKQHKQNGGNKSSKEQTPISPTPPDEKEIEVLALNSATGAESPVPDVVSPDRSENWDSTVDENFVTANNSAEESQNGNVEGLFNSPPRSKELEEDAQNSNTSTSIGTLTPNNSILQGISPNDSKILNVEEDLNSLNNSMDVDDDDEGSLTNASLLVHLSDTACDTMNLQSFAGPSVESSMITSPSSPSQSVPPPSATIKDELQNITDSIHYPDPIQFQTSTPICSTAVTPRRTRENGSGSKNVITGEVPLESWDSTIYQEDPTNVLRANRGFRVDAEDSGNQNSNDFGFMSKESGIYDMSSERSSDSKEKSSDETQGPAILGAVDKPTPSSTSQTNESPLVPAHESPVEAPKPTPPPTKTETSPASRQHPPTLRQNSESEGDDEVEEINNPFLLPSTVTELTAGNGVKVYVVGTAHFSRQSQLDVIETIEKVQPSIVVLELCRSRSGMLSLTEEQIMKEAEDMSFAKFRATIRQSGPVQGLLHLLLLQMTASLTKKLGMAPGGEFRVAVQEAQKIPGCGIHLGDRNLSITLNRALSGLNFFQKVKLAFHFLRANEADITKEEVEACKEKDLLEKLLEEMAGEFPSITHVLLSERDLFLANALWQAATSVRIDRAGNTMPNTRPIVGVVGLGHVGGIVKNWGEIPEEIMAELVVVRESPLAHVIIGKVVKFSFYGLLGYLTYKGSRKLFNFPSNELMSSVMEKTSSALQKLK